MHRAMFIATRRCATKIHRSGIRKNSEFVTIKNLKSCDFSYRPTLALAYFGRSRRYRNVRFRHVFQINELMDAAEHRAAVEVPIGGVQFAWACRSWA